MCIATMKSMTLALKARTALESGGIPVTIVNLDPAITKRGCAYGIRFSCQKKKDALRLLESRHIAWGEILGDTHA